MAPASYSLAKAVFLTIDSASVSGVALSVPEGDKRVRGYDVELFGECRRQPEREQWVREALEAAADLELPLVIAGEEWTPHGISTATFASLCENWGKWLAAIEDVCSVEPSSSFTASIHTKDDKTVEPRRDKVAVEVRIVRVNPGTWHAAVYGKKRPKKSADLKALAVQYVYRALNMPPRLSDNIAEALCIRVWAERAAEVHELLTPKKKRVA